MKRLTILVILLMVLPAVCLGQYKRSHQSRVLPLKIVQLSTPTLYGSFSLEWALVERRSVREFAGRPLDFEQIGQLAWAGQGITEKRRGLRTAPSAGAIYPIELYFATPEGLFVYNPDGHTLKEVFKGDTRSRLAKAALKQKCVADAACDIIIAGSARKLAARYGNRAKRYMLLEAGHVAQNIHLQAVCLGLGSVPVAVFETREVGRICNLPANLEPLYIICVGYPAGQPTTEEAEKQDPPRRVDTKRRVKTAVLIVARENFRDEELFETRRILDGAGVQTVIASSRTGLVRGMLGGGAEARILVNDIVVDDYDAIIFVGGPGASEYFNSPVALNIAREAANKQKVLAAICVAPTVLANAGVLKGVTATSFLSERVRLIRAGARYTGAPVERDGLIITASGPMAAIQFGRAIAEALAGR